MVLKLCHVTRLVVGGVDVMHTCFEAGVHDGEILIRQRHIDDDFGLVAFQQLDQLRDIVRIHGGGLNRALQLSGDAVALRFRAAGQHDLTEYVGKLGAFMNDNAANAAGSDDEDSVGHEGKK